MKLFWALLLLSCALGSNSRCRESIHLEHGAMEIVNGSILFHCDQGYFLQGSKVFTCDRGIPRGKKPFCAKSGCQEYEQIENGFVLSSPLKAKITCLDGYVVVGNRIAYCDGDKWSTQLGFCGLRRSQTWNASCDFESEDMCGWTAEQSFWDTWKRVSAVADFHSERTGPQMDHTFQNHSDGHYVRMETESDAFGSYHFLSPLYPKELSLSTACFQFHYFMFGSGVGSLLVSIKPGSVSMEAMFNTNNFMKFEKTGSQGARWLEHTITIDEMDEDFQVVFTATDARSQYGDIAIDDVKLMNIAECADSVLTTATEPPEEPEELAMEDSLGYQMADCTGRCGQVAVPGRYLNEGCGCRESCLVNGNCCLNYITTCHADLFIAPHNETAFWRLWNRWSSGIKVAVARK
ncbi:MAM and LDL-receptor class A domain-containing protein 1 isoform X1 [Drosophila teissieri]|uniref:MAM and LDL-receptor class A domain-containing protein 1 isoform X1 n=1 Tax=Drosophila teissieri TaxID=7243 RepID=UPI001CBA174C|nr:MAM and LDL-receptor class A domain-containing protein 1 isoform X1 [Drosophila teissieri]